MKNPFYRKEYLPGYTGHVPYKYELYGVTAGDANKILISNGGKEDFFAGTINVKPSNTLYSSTVKKKSTTKYMSKTRPISASKDKRMNDVPVGIDSLASSTGFKLFNRTKSVTQLREDATPYDVNEVLKNSNKSRMAVNWIGGPNHRVQSQHIPGYQGHVHSLIAENMHGKTFGVTTANALNGKVRVGNQLSPDERFKSIN